MEYTTDNIERAVQQFYRDASSQREINKWLMNAQLSPQAWQYPWTLLATDKPPEVQFFGASSLHIKISRFWGQLSAEQINELRNQLMENVVKYAVGPKIVFTRLCVALSTLVLQTTPEIWPDAVNQILSTFQPHNLPHLQSQQVCMLLLEVLTVLPEELSSIYLAPARMGVVRHELRSAIPQVLHVLQSVLTFDSPESIYEQGLKCLSSWVQFSMPLPQLEDVSLQVFNALNNEVYFDTAIETLLQIFLQHENYRYPNSVSNLLPHVLSLRAMWSKAEQQEEIDKLQSLTRLIVTVADQNTKLILAHSRGTSEQRQMVLSLIDMVLQCTNANGYYPVDECSSDLTFGFWYNLQDEITGEESEIYAALVPIFNPIFMSLVNILVSKAQYPPANDYDSWDTESIESLRCYRQDIADTLMYVYTFLHHPLLGKLCHKLEIIVERSKTQDLPWQEIEAVLFAVSSIADSVESDEFVYLPALFNMLGSLPLTHDDVISCALSLIGAYAEWISEHPEVLSSVIPLLLQGIRKHELAQPATTALKDVLRENQAHLQQFVHVILSTTKQVLDENLLLNRDVLRLMACTGYVLSVLPVTEIMQYLDLLLAPHIQQMLHLSQPTRKPADKLIVQQKLSMLTWLFGTLNIEWDKDEETFESTSQSQATQPTQLILQQLMPVLQQTLACWGNDPAIIECTCDMFKRSLRVLMLQASAVYGGVTDLLQQLYQHTPHTAILDLAKVLLVLFAHSQEHKHISKVLFGAMCSRTLKMFEDGLIREHPDILQAFMVFLAQIAKKNNALLCEDVNFGGMFHAGVIGLTMQELPTVKSSCQFLVEFIALSTRVVAINSTVRNEGQNLVDSLVTAIGGESPRSVIDTMADVFLALNKHQFDSLCQWMNHVVIRVGFPNQRVSQQSKEQFARRILKERSMKRRMKEIVQEYTLLWRGLIGTEYATQTQLP